MSYITDNFHKWTLEKQHQYTNGRTALKYVSKGEYGTEEECMATINLPDEPMEENEVAIKSYAENEGLYECMVQAGVISPAVRYAYSGFILAYICKLLV